MHRTLILLLAAVVFLLQGPQAIAGKWDPQWKQVDEAVNKGLPKTAIERLDPIIQGAMQEKAYPEAIKAIAKKIALGLQARVSLQKLSIKLGFSIPRNVFGPGLSIAHGGPIIVHPKVAVGENCRIDRCVSIGSIHYPAGAPRIGNNVFIGPGAVIDGDIEIADGIAIGANSYVNESFKAPGITIAGCPAKKISDNGSKDCWFRATEILRKEVAGAHNDKPK